MNTRKWGGRRLRGMASLAVVLSVVLVAGVALAHMPTISIDPIGNLQYATFPQAYNVTGTASHSEELPPPGLGGDNVCALNAMKVLVNDGVSDVTLLDQGNPMGFFGWTCDQTTASWNTSWSIPGPGTYTITAKIRHLGFEGTDTEDVTVTQITVSQCPAAPAIASAYLRNVIGWKPVSGNFKKIMNQVAGQTGSNGSLWAAHACEGWYVPAVINFVNVLIGL